MSYLDHRAVQHKLDLVETNDGKTYFGTITRESDDDLQIDVKDTREKLSLPRSQVKHVERHGNDVVERWMDVCMSLEELIDPHSMFLKRGPMDRAPANRRKLTPTMVTGLQSGRA